MKFFFQVLSLPSWGAVRHALLLVLAVCAGAHAGDLPYRSGSIVQIRGNEILLRNADVSIPFEAGQKLTVDGDEGTAVIEVTFPMQTMAKCRLVSGKTSRLKIGMVAYAGNKRRADISVGQMKINGDGTVIDARTGLSWASTASSSGEGVNLDDAVASVSELRAGGYSDWRLPDRDEMLTLVDAIPVDVRIAGKGMVFLKERFHIDLSGDQFWTKTRSHDHGATDERYYFCMLANGEIGDIHRVGECSYIAVRGILKAQFRAKGE